MSRRRRDHWYDDPTLLVSDYEQIEKDRAHPITESKTYASMLVARPGSAFKVGEGMQCFDMQGLRDLGFNSLAEASDAALAQIVRPLKAKATPVGGTWKQKRTCEALGQLIDGSLYASSFHQIAHQLVQDGMWATEAFAVWEPDGKKNLRCTRLDPLTSFISSDGSWFVTKRSIPRRKVLQKYGKSDELRAIINDLPCYDPEVVLGADVDGQFASDDNVAVYEAWREGLDETPKDFNQRTFKPSESRDKDYGRHVVSFDDKTIALDEAWPDPIPVIRFHWSHGIRGPADGASLGRAVAPLMAIENNMHLRVDDAIAASVPFTKGKKDPKLSNAPFQHIQWDDEEDGQLEITTPNLVSKDVEKRIEYVGGRIQKRSGINEQAASGEPPPQFKSGVALQRYIGILNKRLSQQHYNHLKLYEDSARIIVTLGPKVWGDKKSIAAATGTSVIEQIDWSDVKMPEDSYRISFDTISDLPDQVPTKDELLEIMKDMGVEDAVDLLANLNTPDYQRRVEVRTGPRNYIEFQISCALDEGRIEPPNDMQDKAMLAKNASEQWQATRCAKVRPPQSHMDALFVLWELASASQISATGNTGTLASTPPVSSTPTAGAEPITTTPTETPALVA